MHKLGGILVYASILCSVSILQNENVYYADNCHLKIAFKIISDVIKASTIDEWIWSSHFLSVA